MTITINGSGTITGATTMASAVSMSGNVTLGGAAVKVLNNSGNPVVGQAGSVLQVVQYTNSTTSSNSSATYATTNLTGSITPSSSTNKILVRAVVQMYYGSSNYSNPGIRINRGGTIVLTNAYSNNVNAIVTLGNPYVIEYLDSPATTSSTTYTIEYALIGSASPYVYPTINTTLSGQTNTSVLTLMEITA